MQVENVTRVGLATRGPTQQQGHGTVGLGLLGQVVEDDQHVLALVHPVLADGRPRVGGDVLVARGIGGRGVHDGGVLQRPGRLKGAAHLRDGGALLTDGHVDAADLLLRVPGPPVGFLVDDRVDRDCGLPGLAVADDQLTLSPADRGHRVDGLDAGLQGFADLLTVHDTGCLEFQGAPALDVPDLTEPVDGIAHRIHYASQIAVADGNGEHLARAAHGGSLVDSLGVAEHDDADLPLVEVEGDAHGAVLKTQQLVRHRRGQTLDTRDAVTGGHDNADLRHAGSGGLVGRDELVQRAADLVGTDGEFSHCVLLSLIA